VDSTWTFAAGLMRSEVRKEDKIKRLLVNEARGAVLLCCSVDALIKSFSNALKKTNETASCLDAIASSSDQELSLATSHCISQ